MTDTLPPKETPSSGLLQPRLVRLIELSRRVVDTSDEPECGCEYQHERCVAMDYRNAVRELESFKKEIDPNYRKCVGKLALAKNKNEAWAIAKY